MIRAGQAPPCFVQARRFSAIAGNGFVVEHLMMSSDIEGDYPPLMRDQIRALREYAATHGAAWKRKLDKEWLAATAHPMLQHLRNTHGPIWLKHFDLPA